MPLPQVFKSPIFLTGVGFCGAGGIGIIGWQIWEESHLTGHKSLSRAGFKRNPVFPDLQADVANGKHDPSSSENPHHLKTYGCFQKFFPGTVAINSIVLENKAMDDTMVDKFTAPDEGEPIGCALMNLSYEWVNDKDVSFIFKSEVVVKNDKFGWALWAGGKNMVNSEQEKGDTRQKNIIYYLIFLNKNVDAWSIIGGYSWYDAPFASEHKTENLHIVTPQKKDWIKEMREDKKPGNKKSRQWSGFWEMLDGGREIFQDIEIWSDGKGIREGASEILGREFGSGKTEIDFSMDPKIDFSDKWYQKNKGWTRFEKKSDGTDKYKNIGSILNNLYGPWKGKRGVWKETQDFCKKQSSKRSLNKSEMRKLRIFCYSK